MNICQALSSEKRFLSPIQGSNIYIYIGNVRDEDCGFDFRLGLRNRFSKKHSYIIQDIFKLPHFQNIYLKIKMNYQ